MNKSLRSGGPRRGCPTQPEDVGLMITTVADVEGVNFPITIGLCVRGAELSVEPVSGLTVTPRLCYNILAIGWARNSDNRAETEHD